MSKDRFPQNWATAELVKQYMRNHRRYEVKKGRMMPRHQRFAVTSSGTSSGTSKYPNIDFDEDEDMNEEDDEDANEEDESNKSDSEEDD